MKDKFLNLYYAWIVHGFDSQEFTKAMIELFETGKQFYGEDMNTIVRAFVKGLKTQREEQK